MPIQLPDDLAIAGEGFVVVVQLPPVHGWAASSGRRVIKPVRRFAELESLESEQVVAAEEHFFGAPDNGLLGVSWLNVEEPSQIGCLRCLYDVCGSSKRIACLQSGLQAIPVAGTRETTRQWNALHRCHTELA